MVDFKSIDRRLVAALFVPVRRSFSEELSPKVSLDGSSTAFQKINESDMLLLPDPDTAFLDPALHHPDAERYLRRIQPGTMERYSRRPAVRREKSCEAYLTEKWASPPLPISDLRWSLHLQLHCFVRTPPGLL